MNDSKNFILAGICTIIPMFDAIETQKMIPVISAIILPIFFFCLGKTVDVFVQIYFRRLEAKRRDELKPKKED